MSRAKQGTRPYRWPGIQGRLQPQPVQAGHRTQRLLFASKRHRTASVALSLVALLCLLFVGYPIHAAQQDSSACYGAWSTAALSVSHPQGAATSLPNQGLALFAGGSLGGTSQKDVITVDIFDVISRRWSTSALSVARGFLAAASLPNQGLAIFAGGLIGGAADSNAVDIFRADGLWTTAALSEARWSLQATSLPNHGLVMFAGGISIQQFRYSRCVDIFDASSGLWTAAVLSSDRVQLAATSLPDQALALFAGGFVSGSTTSAAVDIFNASSGRWSTASLSVARAGLAATSLPKQGLAIFAGGGQSVSDVVDIFDATSGRWSSAALSMARGFIGATSLPFQGLAMFAGGSVGNQNTNVVDIFDASSRRWSAAVLSVARRSILATSLPNQGLVIFAGGFSSDDGVAVDVYASCPLGCCFAGNNSLGLASACVLCPAGSYNDRYGATACLACSAGSYNPGTLPAPSCTLCRPGTYSGFAQSAACAACPPGTYNPSNGSDACAMCPAGAFNPQKGSVSAGDCLLCPKGSFNSETGAVLCRACPAGSSCPADGSTTPCACDAFQYQPRPGQTSCESCPLPSTIVFNATTCNSQAATSRVSSAYYYLLAILFLFISVFAIALTVRLMRSRANSSLRTVHYGICLYVALFAPYAALQAVTLIQLASLNSRGANSLDRAATQISSSAAFAAFFGLVFSGKVALVQMWRHVVWQHTSASFDSRDGLQRMLTYTYKAFVWAVAVVVVLYVIGFSLLRDDFFTSFSSCEKKRLKFECLNSLQQLAQPCSDTQARALAVQYFEGICAVVVVMIFTSLAFLFNGVVFAMLTHDRALSKWQLMLVHSQLLRRLARPLFPAGWTPGSFQTMGEIDTQRVALQTLGTRLANLSIFSFLCKSVATAVSYFAQNRIAQSEERESLIFLVTLLSVQAVPCVATLLLLYRFYFVPGSSNNGVLNQSLLLREGQLEADAVAATGQAQLETAEKKVKRTMREAHAPLQQQPLILAAATESSETRFEIGDNVFLHGLTCANEANGCRAIVLSHLTHIGRIEVHITHPADLAQRFAPSVAMLAENLSSVQMVAAAPTEEHSSKFIELPHIDS